MFDWIGVIFGYVLNFFFSMTGNYAIAIFLFTIVTRILMFPLTISQHKSSARMARISPKQKELQKKYANNKEKYNEELQKLYQKEGVSTTAGCLPMLIQFPIIIGLFAAIRNPLTHVLKLGEGTIAKLTELFDMGSDAYGQVKILSGLTESNTAAINAIEPGLFDKLQDFAGSFNLGINLLPIPNEAESLFPIIIIPILVFVSQFFSMWITQKINKTQQTGGCNPLVMGVVMSLITFWFSMSVPAALGFYWICSSLISPLQTLIVNKFYNAGILNAKSEAQRLARLNIEEEKVISSIGRKEFLPNYNYQVTDIEENSKKKKKK